LGTQIFWTLSGVVASGILPDVEPGFQPGGKNRVPPQSNREQDRPWHFKRGGSPAQAGLYCEEMIATVSRRLNVEFGRGFVEKNLPLSLCFPASNFLVAGE